MWRICNSVAVFYAAVPSPDKAARLVAVRGYFDRAFRKRKTGEKITGDGIPSPVCLVFIAARSRDKYRKLIAGNNVGQLAVPF